MMKLYTFLDEDGEIIEEVRAEQHSEAVEKATDRRVVSSSEELPYGTDFYSSNIEN